MKNGYESNRKPSTTQQAPINSDQQPQGGQIAVDGFQQVIEMLKIADPAFRESLLNRLAARDRELAKQLRADLEI
jgi:hypothetical protein